MNLTISKCVQFRILSVVVSMKWNWRELLLFTEDNFNRPNVVVSIQVDQTASDEQEETASDEQDENRMKIQIRNVRESLTVPDL